MSKSKLDFTTLTARFPQQVMALSDLIKKGAFEYGNITELVSIISDVRYRQKIGLLGELGDIGQTTAGSCAYNKIAVTVPTTEKEWNPQLFDTWLTLCSDDIMNTIGRLTLKDGVDMHDMTATQYLDYFVMALEIAIGKMYWRMVFMGDKTAANWSGSPVPGVITDTVDVKFFNMIDGLWKRARTIAAAAPAQYKVIAANAQTTYATQDSVLTPAIALAHAKSLYTGAPLNIKQKMYSGGMIAPCTLGYFDKLTANFKSFELESMRVDLENGMRAVKINGIPFFPVLEWSDMINKYENSGAKWNEPHRVLVMDNTNALVAVPSLSEWGNFKVHFSEETDQIYIKIKDMIDALFLQDNEIMIGL